MAKKQQRQVVCMVFLLVAFLVISAMHAVPAEAAGRLQSHVLPSHLCVVNNLTVREACSCRKDASRVVGGLRTAETRRFGS